MIFSYSPNENAAFELTMTPLKRCLFDRMIILSWSSRVVVIKEDKFEDKEEQENWSNGLSININESTWVTIVINMTDKFYASSPNRKNYQHLSWMEKPVVPAAV